MKKLICATGIILIACAVTGNLFTAGTDASAQTVQQSNTEDKCEEDVFILKIEDGYLNVYYKESGNIYLKTGTMSSNLPKSDVMQLEKVLKLQGRKRLEEQWRTIAVKDF